MREGQKTATARRLRRDMTDAERLLWRTLRMRHLGGFKFRRQHPVGPYVVDFACLAARLVIEVDGGQHAGLASDVGRDAYLCRSGYRVLRFWNNDVLANIEGVCDVILHRLTGSAPHPGLSGPAQRAVRSADARGSAAQAHRPHLPHAGEGADGGERPKTGMPPLPLAGEGWGEGDRR